MTPGLFDKYDIRKKDGHPVDPEGQYFVLRLDTDNCLVAKYRKDQDAS